MNQIIANHRISTIMPKNTDPRSVALINKMIQTHQHGRLKKLELAITVFRFRCDNGYGPTYRELAMLMNKSVGFIQYHIKPLLKYNILTQQAGLPRTLRVTNPKSDYNIVKLIYEEPDFSLD